MIANNKFLNLVPMSWITPAVMFGLSMAAIVASGMSTYDISYNLSPVELATYIATCTVLVIDGGYILLDMIFPYVKTQTARTLIALFMVMLWLMMVMTNITDAIWRNNTDVGSYVIYGVKVMGLLWLAVYTFIRYDDPETKRTLQETELREIREAQTLYYEKQYATSLAPVAGRALALAQLSDRFKEDTGRNIEDVLGKNWAVEHLGELGQAPAQNDAAGHSKGKKSLSVPIPAPVVEESLMAKARGLLKNVNIATNPTTPQGQ